MINRIRANLSKDTVQILCISGFYCTLVLTTDAYARLSRLCVTKI